MGRHSVWGVAVWPVAPAVRPGGPRTPAGRTYSRTPDPGPRRIAAHRAAAVGQQTMTMVLLLCQLALTGSSAHRSAATMKHTAKASHAPLNVWPEPKYWAAGGGFLALDPHQLTVTYVTSVHGRGPRAPTGTLARALERWRSSAFPHHTAAGKAAAAAAGEEDGAGCRLTITVTIDASAELQLGVSEAYVLQVAAGSNRSISLSAATQIGVLRGLETLAQLISFDFDDGGSYAIQRTPLTIDDAPRFPHREVLMDSARHVRYP
jgi:hypothetical protein